MTPSSDLERRFMSRALTAHVHRQVAVALRERAKAFRNQGGDLSCAAAAAALEDAARWCDLDAESAGKAALDLCPTLFEEL